MIVDLSQPIYHGMPVYPGDPEAVIIPAGSYDREGYILHSITFGSHAGTHVDAPLHFVKGGTAVDAPSVLEACIGSALVCDVTHVSAQTEITPDDLGASLERITPGDRVLLATGWSERLGREEYYTGFPGVSSDLAMLLSERDIALLGVESPSLHRTLSDIIHKQLFAAGIVVVENLSNLRQLAGRRVFFSAAPLKLQGLEGSPARAYAVLEE
ncbi:MAG: cyclase family protein [Candidatus Latescibacterota bacterium]